MECIDHGREGNVHGYSTKYQNGTTHGLHRLVYAEANAIPITALKGKVVRHVCDNPRCINPAHLLLGTQKDNMADMKQRGRNSHLRGDESYKVRLLTASRSSIMKTHLTRIFFVISVVLYMLGIFSFEVTVLLGLLAILDPQHYPK